MKTYAFIFARGGSKGLPRKNIKLLAGKPLIVHSIEAARNTPGIDEIFVSTEDMEIATIAEQAGAVIINRPQELATDNAPEWAAWRHAVAYVTHHHGAFDFFVSLPPTSPLRSTQDIKDALELFKKNIEADVCIGVTPSNRNPFFNMIKKSQDGYCELVCEMKEQTYRRQDAPVVFDITTVVYVTRPSFILNKSGIFEGRVISIEIPKSRAVDIDDIFDFRMAEILINSSDSR